MNTENVYPYKPKGISKVKPGYFSHECECDNCKKKLGNINLPKLKKEVGN